MDTEEQFLELLQGVNSEFSSSEFSKEIKHTIVMNYLAGVDVSCVLNPGFTKEAVEEILSCVEDGIPITEYVDCSFTAEQIRLVKRGLIQGLDVNQYAQSGWDYNRMLKRFEALASVAIVGVNEYSIESPHALNQFLKTTLKKLSVF